MRILTLMGPTTLPKHHAMLLMWALLLLQGMIVITLLFGVFYLVDLQRTPMQKLKDLQNEHEMLKRQEDVVKNHTCPPPKATDAEEEMSPLEKSVPLYIVTATFPRPEQLAELTRLGQTLKHVKNMMWIVADDAPQPTKQIMNLLYRLKISHKYVLGQMPKRFWSWEAQPKGVANRNNGVNWVLSHVDQIKDDRGVLYFADDDNTYDLKLFTEIRKTRRVSVFPVGFVSGRPVSTPVIKNGRIVEFYEGWIGGRTYPLDMAGFAVTIKQLKMAAGRDSIAMPYSHTDQENGFLKALGIPPYEFQPLANGCSEILVWHTRTVPVDDSDFKPIDRQVLMETNLGKLSNYWCMFMGTKRCNGQIDEHADKVSLNLPLRQKIELFMKMQEGEEEKKDVPKPN